VRLLAAGFFVWTFSGVAAGQTRGEASVSPSDSSRLLRAAKSAQVKFESERRSFAPTGAAIATAPCQTIGRFCHYPSRVPYEEIPAEPAATGLARRRLLRTLAATALRIPGDGWVAGQQVRYLIEAGDDSTAAEVARSCRAERWWCDALSGLVSHSSSRFVAAEQGFAKALEEMPSAMRCQWTDLSPILDGQARDAYEKLGCDARQSANARIWWLADPLFATPGNERRTEHYARRVWAQIERGGANGFGLSWGGDMEEMIIRYGWGEKWSRRPAPAIGDGSPAYIEHEREPAFHFLPNVRYDAPLASLGDSAWSPDDDKAREGYAPSYAAAFVRITPQLARFRRGDSTLLVAAFDVGGDTAWHRDAVRPALVIAPTDTTRFLLSLFDSTGRKSALWITFPSREALASVELLSLGGKTAGRWRGVVAPIVNRPGQGVLSDLLLFDATDSLPNGIDGAIAAAFGNNRVPQNRKAVIYWESYGETAADSALSVSLTLTPASPGLVTRVIRALGIGKKLAPLDLRWRDAGPAATVRSRSVLLDLSQVTPGRYDLRLAIGEGAAARSTSRAIVITRAPDNR